jgi:TrmH family RNA methyltransferase
MLSKSTIKYVRSLRQQKYRQKYHKIAVEGVKSVHEVLAGELLEVEQIYATPEWISARAPDYPQFKSVTISITESELAGISSFTTPQEVLAVCEMPGAAADPAKTADELCLYLDGIRDPGNLGTIFRIADWFGIRNLFLAEDCVDPFNPKVIQASMGSLFRVHWATIPLQLMLDREGLIAYAASMEGESIYAVELSGKGLIILGNESTGIRDIRHKTVKWISIPGKHTLGAESLNVAVAAGIICAEFRRRIFINE